MSVQKSMVFNPDYYEACVRELGFTVSYNSTTSNNSQGHTYLSRYVKGDRRLGERLLLWVTYDDVATLGVAYKDRLTNIKSNTPGHVNRGQTPEDRAAIDNMVNAALNQIALWQLEDLNLGNS
jgi:hypothetical protein